MVERGVSDLSVWNFQENKELSLRGRWAFYPNKFIHPSKFHDKRVDEKPIYLRVPSIWTSKENKGKGDLKKFGHGTYVLKLKGLKVGEHFYFNTGEYSSAAHGYLINGSHYISLFKFGEIGKKFKEEVPQLKEEKIRFVAESNEVIFVIHNSNFNYRGRWCFRSPSNFKK